MEVWFNIGLAILIAVYGGLILDRLPKSRRRQGFTFEHSDRRVTFRLETILEDDFNVGFVDDWQTGRNFSLYGSIVPRDDEESKDAPPFGKRTGVQIGGTPDWFKSSRIGGVRTYGNGSSDCFVALPYQIAQDVLNEVRRDPNQLVTLGYRRVLGKDGKSTFPITSLALAKPIE